jgi:hypothetical protein
VCWQSGEESLARSSKKTGRSDYTSGLSSEFLARRSTVDR